MKKLLQIIYISRSTFESSAVVNKIEPNVARILSKSRLNNRKNGLVGVLYFGDGVFFQCLEGEEEIVNTLLEKLNADSRHTDLKVISKKYIDKLSFGEWAMKFAPLDEQIIKFLKENGFQTFNPYMFSGEVINKFLDQLFYALDPSEVVASTNNDRNRISPIDSSKDKSNLALVFSFLALCISLITFLSAQKYL